MRRLSALHAWARCGSAEHPHKYMPGLPVLCSWQDALNLPSEQTLTCIALPAWQLLAAHQARTDRDHPVHRGSTARLPIGTPPDQGITCYLQRMAGPPGDSCVHCLRLCTLHAFCHWTAYGMRPLCRLRSTAKPLTIVHLLCSPRLGLTDGTLSAGGDVHAQHQQVLQEAHLCE